MMEMHIGLPWLFFRQPQKHRPRAKSPSGGRAEVLRRGTSRRDAARGVMGQGWPMYAGPRSNTGAREVERSETRMQGRVSFAYFSLHGQRKVRRPRGRNTKHQRIRWCAEHEKHPHPRPPLCAPVFRRAQAASAGEAVLRFSRFCPVNGRGEQSAPQLHNSPTGVSPAYRVATCACSNSAVASASVNAWCAWYIGRL